MVTTASVVWLCVGAAWCVLLPVAILVWWRRTHKARLLPALVGALVFLVFARGLEGAMHMVCLLGDNPVARAINGNPYLYMLYGGLAAGVFEETGRYVAFRFLLPKRRHPGRDTAVTYGIGHGGIESIALVGVMLALYAALAIFQKTGNFEAALALTKGDAAALAELLGQLERFTPGTCLLTMVERAAAMLLHIGLSVYVFLAVRDRTQWSYFPFAVALHAIADMPAALYQRDIIPMWAAELWTVVFALYVLRSARKCYLELTDP